MPNHPPLSDSSTIQARLSDSEGPWWLRNLWWMILGPISVMSFVSGIPGASMFLALLGFLVGPLLPFRFRPKQVRIKLGTGEISILDAGPRNQTIHARDVRGATTARTSHGLTLMLATRSRENRPIALTMKSEEELVAARDALGIGHHGFGQVRWQMPNLGITSWFRFVGGALMLAGGATQLADLGLFHVFAYSLATLVAFVTLLAWIGSAGSNAYVELETRGVSLHFRKPKFGKNTLAGGVPWHAITDVSMAGNVFRVASNAGAPIFAPLRVRTHLRDGCDPEELEQLESAILAGTGRARGLTPPKEETHTRVEVLKKGKETVADWLARVDAEASQMLAQGYRGSTIDKDDLYLLVRDPDAEPDLRAAAVRILGRIDPERSRVRVETALATARRDEDAALLRAALVEASQERGTHGESSRGSS